MGLFDFLKKPAEPARPARALTGNFNPGANAVPIHYQNARGEMKQFVGDKTTIRDAGAHFSLCVAPTGTRIALAKARVQNLTAVPIPVEPRGVERQILTFHLRRGSTSPRFEELRARFPDWQP